MFQSALIDHPGFTFTAAGSGYRLYRHGDFLTWCSCWDEMIEKVQESANA